MPEQEVRADSVSNTVRGLALLILLALVGPCLAILWPGRPPAQAKSTEPPPAQSSRQTAQQAVGAKCVSCHRPYVESFALEAHGKSAKFVKDSRAAMCDTCHGDSEKHIANREKRVAAQDIDGLRENDMGVT